MSTSGRSASAGSRCEVQSQRRTRTGFVASLSCVMVLLGKPELHAAAAKAAVGFPLEPHLARLLRAGFAAERHVILVSDGLGADKAPLEVRMDDGGRLRRLGAARDRPG